MHSKLCRRRQEGEPEPILCVRSKEGKNLKEKKNTDIHKEWGLSVANTAPAVLLRFYFTYYCISVCSWICTCCVTHGEVTGQCSRVTSTVGFRSQPWVIQFLHPVLTEPAFWPWPFLTRRQHGSSNCSEGFQVCALLAHLHPQLSTGSLKVPPRVALNEQVQADSRLSHRCTPLAFLDCKKTDLTEGGNCPECSVNGCCSGCPC